MFSCRLPASSPAGAPVVAAVAAAALAPAETGAAPGRSGIVWPTNGWTEVSPESVGLDSTLLAEARDYAGGGAGIVARGGYQVLSWGPTLNEYELKSTTKSIGSMLLGLAVADGLVALDDAAVSHLPGVGIPPAENGGTGWLDDLTVRQLATHAGGFEKTGGFGDLLHEPGTVWLYSDGGANWLGDLLTVRFGQDLAQVFLQRIVVPLGMAANDFDWRANALRADTIQGIERREIASGMHANADLLARLGYLWLRGGQWEGEQILPAGFVEAARQPDPSIAGLVLDDPAGFPDATSRYGLLWWNNANGIVPDVPTDACWAWGLNENLIVVIPSLDLVASRTGANGWQSGWNGDPAVLEGFLQPLARAAAPAVGAPGGPQPSSWAGIKGRYRSPAAPERADPRRSASGRSPRSR